MRKTFLTLFVVAAVACANSAPTPESPTPSVPAEPAEGRAKLTAEECQAQGGKVVGDIGDGAIFRPEYTCPDSGQAPIGDITATAGQPVAIEGAVCCK